MFFAPLFSSGFPRPSRGRGLAARARGFTLVELAIAMSILGLMIGLGLQPMQERLRNDDLRDTREILRQASDAVVSYAMSRGVEPRRLQVFGSLREIPGGRPYLPCPDVDGDGFEDRFAGGAVANPLLARDLSHAEANRDKPNGHCRHYKGLLPWRTIGGPEADNWGTHLTYRVDPNFANSALGFDELTRAETPDTFDWLSGTSADEGEYQSRDGDDGDDNNGTIAPAEICLVYDCKIADPGRRGLDGTEAEERGFLHDHKIGLVALEDLDVGRGHEVGDIVDAPVFVILSHGENRRGGVSADSGQCVPIFDDQDRHELQNAFYYLDFFNQHPLIASSNCYTRTVPPAPASGSYLSEAVFVERPPTHGLILIDDTLTMDDVLIWMSANELANRMARARDLPPPLDFVGEAR